MQAQMMRLSIGNRRKKRAEGKFSKLRVNVDVIILPRIESFINKRTQILFAALKWHSGTH